MKFYFYFLNPKINNNSYYFYSTFTNITKNIKLEFSCTIIQINFPNLNSRIPNSSFPLMNPKSSTSNQ